MIEFPSNTPGGGGGNTSNSQNCNVSSNLGGTSLTASVLNSFRAGSFGAIGSGGANQNAPPALDLNEFPSLGGANINNFSSSSSSGRPAYVGMVKETVGGAPGGLPIGLGGSGQLNAEFNIQTEDFPALPGSGPMTAAQAAAVAAAAAAASNNSGGNSSLQFGNFSASAGGDIDGLTNGNGVGKNESDTNSSQRATSPSQTASSQKNVLPSYSIQFSKEGHPLNPPAGLLSDPFGIVGFVHLLQTLDLNPNLRNLMLGFDPSTINLNLKSKERLYQSYSGPWCDRNLRPHEIDYPVPQEYLVYSNCRDKLPPVDGKQVTEDMLFFYFYFHAGESLQHFASQELYKRDWRFHKDERSWICRRPGAPLLEKQATYERGSYHCFDPSNWMKRSKDMLVEYDRLDPPPSGLQI